MLNTDGYYWRFFAIERLLALSIIITDTFCMCVYIVCLGERQEWRFSYALRGSYWLIERF